MKFYRVAKAGMTVDGRTITKEQIEQMAASYDPKVYGARINTEHFLSLHPDGAFPPLGDVLAAKVEYDGNNTYLLCALNPSADLKRYNAEGKKVYTSIEMHPDFQKTGSAYLLGLAVTDRPASTGTEFLKFSIAAAKASDDDTLKMGSGMEDTLFTAFFEADTLDFSVQEDDKSTFLDKFKTILAKGQKNTDGRFGALENGMIEMAEAHADARKETSDQVDALTQTVDGLKNELSALTEKLAQTPTTDHNHRPPSDGVGDHVATDC